MREVSQVDLTNCDREPIHIPGRIQPHGLLLRLSEPDFTITHVSANTETLLGLAPHALIGQKLAILLASDQIDSLFERLRQSDLVKHNPHQITLQHDGRRRTFEGIAHRFKDQLILELEPARERTGIEFTSFYHQARESVQRLRTATDLAALYDIAVSEVRRITNFDRVLIYRFDEDWNGHVLAEEIGEGIPSYLDLHFPASDIPRQARELYLLNRLRIIPTIDYTPVTIVPAPVIAETGEPIDLSLSILRNVSPIHLEYLHNMGVKASMSVSITKNNRLWGLISCTHERGPLFVPYDVRAICDFLGETLSSLLPVHESDEDAAYRVRLATTQGVLLHSMTQADDFVRGLLNTPESLLEIAGATGAAICYDDQFHVVGEAPSDADLRKIVAAITEQDHDEVFSTASLPSVIPSAESFKDKACGVMAFSISKAQANYFLWFRPEVVQTVNWGGNPNKAVQADGASVVLHPRKSFDKWKQTVRLRSLPWREEEKQAITTLRASIIDIVLQRVERITKLNVELERSNNELDSFAYAASHDLKEPLRGIHNYAGIIMRDDGDRLTDQSRARMQTILRLTQRSEDLINSLLHYSQIGRTDLLMRKTEMTDVVRNALDTIKSRIEEEHVRIQMPEGFPAVVCDKVQMTEVFTNLISNAIKYNSASGKTVEIGAKEESGRHPIFFVRDNGIGIDARHHQTVFKIFRRLHAKDKFGGGTGTGLTITKKIIERHGGAIWVESKPGQGTTFYFTVAQGNANVGQ